jgi:hypothetical protein
MPRLIRSAPNGDLFIADSGAGTIFILRGVGPHGKAAQVEKFATALDHPFGIAFYPADDPQFVYAGNATTVQRIPYHSGDLHSTTAPETIVPDIPRLRPAHRWRSLDPRRGLHERRSTLACLRGLGLEPGRPGHSSERSPPRRCARPHRRTAVRSMRGAGVPQVIRMAISRHKTDSWRAGTTSLTAMIWRPQRGSSKQETRQKLVRPNCNDFVTVTGKMGILSENADSIKSAIHDLSIPH